MIDWIDKSWEIVWNCAMTNSQWWSLVGYSKHEAQRRQTLGHQVWYIVLPAPAGQMKMMTAVDVVKWLQRQAEWLLVGSVALNRADSHKRERSVFEDWTADAGTRCAGLARGHRRGNITINMFMRMKRNNLWLARQGQDRKNNLVGVATRSLKMALLLWTSLFCWH